MTGPLLVVANADAGSSDRAAVHEMVGALAEQGPVELEWTDSPDQLDALVADTSAGRIASAGGDGSVNALVSALDRAGRLDVVVAVLPLGTGNDLAGALGVESLDVAIDAATGDAVQRVDLLDSNLGLAVNAFHLGVGAVASQRAASWKPRVGRIAYPIGAVAAGLAAGPWDLTVTIDGRRVADGKHVLVSMANGWRVGGGFELNPDADPSDGTIDVVLVGDTGRVGRARLAAAGIRGDITELDDVGHHAGREVKITSDEPLPGSRDGELLEDLTEITVELRPGALGMCVPAGDALGSGSPVRADRPARWWL